MTGKDEASDRQSGHDDTSFITADEIALYDRQIRLWGVKAQESIQKANVLLVSMKALANEVAKNLVLAGIRSLTVADHELVTPQDLGAQFFISEEDVGKNRAEAAAPSLRQLNPRVHIHTETHDIRAKEPSYLASFDVIVATDLDFPTTSTLNAISRLGHKPFYAAGAHGFYGYIFADLINHKFVRELSGAQDVKPRFGKTSLTQTILRVDDREEGGKTTRAITYEEAYSPLLLANTSPLPAAVRHVRRKLAKVSPLLPCLRALWEFEMRNARTPSYTPTDLCEFTKLATEKHQELGLLAPLTAEFLRKFLQNLNGQLVPVTAMLGGMLAQDVINVIGQREQPIQNLVLFNGDDYSVPVYPLHPGNFDDDGQSAVNGRAQVVAKEAMPAQPILL